jgi:hypothetical protein
MSITTSSPAAKRRTAQTGKDSYASPRKRALHRTTVTLSPESQEIVERFKSATGTSASAAIDQIIRRSEPKPSRLKNVNGFLVLDIPAGNQHFTIEDVKQAEDDLDREYVERMYSQRKPVRQKKKMSNRK